MNAPIRTITPELVQSMLTRSFHEVQDYCFTTGFNIGEVWNAVITQREHEKRIKREQAVQRVMQAAKDGTDIELSPNDIAEAKLYVRARAINELNKSIDTLVKVRDDEDAKSADRIKAAESLLNRAIGPAEAPNAIPFQTDLAQASPVEIINAVMEGFAIGTCSEAFAKTITTLLGGKVQAQRLDDMVVARARTINGNASSAIPSWANPQPVQQSGHVNGAVITVPVNSPSYPPYPPSNEPVASG